MLDTSFQRRASPGVSLHSGNSPSATALLVGWCEGLAIVNVRGNPDDAAFRDAVSQPLGVPLPLLAGSCCGGDPVRIVWAGPNEWFVIGPMGQADSVVSQLRIALAGTHHAVTDVSSGYTVLSLAGQPVREVLAQGCPLDLHPRVFKKDHAAGTHYFKASVWLWQTEPAPAFGLLVRNSFRNYVSLMLERCGAECGLVTRRFSS